MTFKSILIAAGALVLASAQTNAAVVSVGPFTVDETAFSTSAVVGRAGASFSPGDIPTNSIGSDLSTFEFLEAQGTFEFQFANPLINGSGVDLLIFEMVIGTVQRPFVSQGLDITVNGQTFDLNLGGLTGARAVPFDSTLVGPFTPGSLLVYSLDFTVLGIGDGEVLDSPLIVSSLASNTNRFAGLAGIAGINQTINAVPVPAALPMLAALVGVLGGGIALRNRRSGETKW